MADVSNRMLRFLTRSGRAVTIADNAGETHHATLTRIEDSVSIRDEGSFSFGYCKSCNWVGSARRARGKARADALTHLAQCLGKGKVRIGVSQA